MDDKRHMLRHFLAALAYRTQKSLRGASHDFADFDPGSDARTPMQLVRHMASVLGYALTFFIGGSYQAVPLPTFQGEIDRFHQMLEDLRKHLEAGTPCDITEEQMLQGPFSDAMTHAGQLALLRRLHGGAPVQSENFIYAAISPENLTREQPEPVAPDE